MSSTGLGPCEKCSKKTYQKGYGNTFCTQCKSEDDDSACIESMCMLYLDHYEFVYVLGPCEVQAKFADCLESKIKVYYTLSEKTCQPVASGRCTANKNSFISFADCATFCG